MCRPTLGVPHPSMKPDFGHQASNHRQAHPSHFMHGLELDKEHWGCELHVYLPGLVDTSVSLYPGYPGDLSRWQVVI